MARRACAEPRPGKLSGISTFARETRASRPLAHVGAEVSGRITAIEIAHAQLYNVDADRKKRVDLSVDGISLVANYCSIPARNGWRGFCCCRPASAKTDNTSPSCHGSVRKQSPLECRPP
jgi:hypothetical protein